MNILIPGLAAALLALADTNPNLQPAQSAVTAGGGKTDGGSYTLHGVYGQPVAGRMSQGAFVLQVGILLPIKGPSLVEHIFSDGFEGE